MKNQRFPHALNLNSKITERPLNLSTLYASLYRLIAVVGGGEESEGVERVFAIFLSQLAPHCRNQRPPFSSAVPIKNVWRVPLVDRVFEINRRGPSLREIVARPGARQTLRVFNCIWQINGHYICRSRVEMPVIKLQPGWCRVALARRSRRNKYRPIADRRAGSVTPPGIESYSINIYETHARQPFIMKRVRSNENVRVNTDRCDRRSA